MAIRIRFGPSASLPCSCDVIIGKVCYAETEIISLSLINYLYSLAQLLRINIRSEGCNDPGIQAGTCGYGSIRVNGWEKARRKRGYNVVVINADTGKYTYHYLVATHQVQLSMPKKSGLVTQWSCRTSHSKFVSSHPTNVEGMFLTFVLYLMFSGLEMLEKLQPT